MANKRSKTTECCIRVLHFVSSLSRGSGVMSVIMTYYRHIDRKKIQFDFIFFNPCEDSYIKEIRSLDGRIYYVDKPGSSFQSVIQLNTFFRKHAEEYTWLHNHEVYLTFLLRPISKKFGLKKFIVHCHATKYSDRPLNALRNKILCLPIQFMKVERFACSEAAGKFLYGEKKLNNGYVFIMHNAIDCEKFQFRPEVREGLRLAMGLEGKFVIGHVGRFERQKNHSFLIQAFAKVAKRLPDSILLLIGEGSLKESVKHQVIEQGLKDNVIFLGQKNNIGELLNVMDLFVLPSLFEGLGIVLLEAQINGLECIVSKSVPQEVSLGNVCFLPIKRASSLWENYILNISIDKQTKNRSRLASSKQHISQITKTYKSICVAVKTLQKKYIGEVI